MDGIPALAEDLHDLLKAFTDHEVRFLIVGGYALAVHGHPRATGDLDVWIDCSPTNAARAYEALRVFGAPLHELTPEDLTIPGTVYQIGLPPVRIDVLTHITGVDFETAWRDRQDTPVDDLVVPVIGRAALLDNKRALGRTRDLADIELLEADERG